MSQLKIARVSALPTPLVANTIYLLQVSDSELQVVTVGNTAADVRSSIIGTDVDGKIAASVGALNTTLSQAIADAIVTASNDATAKADAAQAAANTYTDDRRNGLVEMTTGPGGRNRLLAGSREIYPVENPPSAENRLVCVDALPFLALSENATYIFGRAVDATMVLRPKAGGADISSLAVTTLYKEDGVTLLTSAAFYTCWAWDDYQLAQVRDFTSQNSYLYKSIDNFATCGSNAPLYNNNKPVFCVGWNSARDTAAGNVSIMAAWSLTRATNRRGEDLVVFGQYNVNTSRAAGGANDWSNVLCSRNNGDTWDVVLELNTGGENIVRHCHAVQFDPYEKEFWIQYGDGDSSAFFVWDGIHPIAPNTRARDAAQYRGWRGMDLSNNPTGNWATGQTTTLFFLPDVVIAPIDHGFTAARGVYRLSRDLSVFEQITDPDEIGHPEGHALYSGTMCQRTGAMIVSTLIEAGYKNPSADYTLWIWVATPAGNYRDWTRVGRYMINTTTGSRQHMQMLGRADGTIWIGASNGAGKEVHSTAVCLIDGLHSGEEEVIHPVYWVDPIKGNNANNGYSPATAWAGVGYACGGNRMTCSALLNVLPGRTVETATSWSLRIGANARPAQTNYPLLVRGAGRKRSVIASTATSAWLVVSETKVSAFFESVSIENAVGPVFDYGVGATEAHVATFRDVFLKSAGAVFLVTSGKIKVDQFEAEVGTYLGAALGTANFAFEADAGVVRGGSRILYWKGGAGAYGRLENVIGIGQTVAGVDLHADAVTLPVVRNVAIDAAVPVVRDNRTTKTTAAGLVSNNVGRGASTGLIDGDEGSQVVSDLMLIGTTGAPKPGSPLIGAGNANAGPALDINGVAYGTPKNVGAFA